MEKALEVTWWCNRRPTCQSKTDHTENLNEQQREALRAFAEAGGIKVEEQQEDGFFDKFKDALAGKAEVVF